MTKELVIKGIKSVAGESKKQNYRSGCYLQLNYDKKTGKVWANEHCSFGQNSWTAYEEENIVVCGNITRPMTMEEIKEMVKDAVARH